MKICKIISHINFEFNRVGLLSLGVPGVQDFGRSVNLIPTKGGRLCPPNNTCTPGSSDLPTALETLFKFPFDLSAAVIETCMLSGNLCFNTSSWHFWSLFLNCFHFSIWFPLLNVLTLVGLQKRTEDKGWLFSAWSWKLVFSLLWKVHSGQLKYENSSIDATFQGLEFIIIAWK